MTDNTGSPTSRAFIAGGEAGMASAGAAASLAPLRPSEVIFKETRR